MKQEALYNEMSTVLQDLIDTAKKLKELSQKKVVEEEFNELQDRQNELIKKLIELDAVFLHEKFLKDRFKSLHDGIEKKFQEFQKINSDLLDSLKSRLSVIQFTQVRRSNED